MNIADGSLMAGLDGGHGNGTNGSQLAIVSSASFLLVSIRVQHMRGDFPQHNLRNQKHGHADTNRRTSQLPDAERLTWPLTHPPTATEGLSGLKRKA